MKARRWLLLGALTAVTGCATAPSMAIETATLPSPDAAIPTLMQHVKRPAYDFAETMPIDLPTVLRLVNENSPTIAIARTQLQQAQARLDMAELQWLPSISVGAAYFRSDGQTQNQSGSVFEANRGNLFANGGVALEVDAAEAIYRPLVERRARAAADYKSQAVALGSELEAVLAYLELVQVYARMTINKETLEKVEAMVNAAQFDKALKPDRSASDILRARTELYSRSQERIDLQGAAGVASARLGKLLLLPPSVKLIPVESAVVPVTLIDRTRTLESLIDEGLRNHPELHASQASLAAAGERVRLAKRGPCIPKLTVANQVGSFGGGLNNDLQAFDARNVLSVNLFWQLKNLGFGNRVELAAQRALEEQSRYELSAAQARRAAEIAEIAAATKSRAESIDYAVKAYREAAELYRVSQDSGANVDAVKSLLESLSRLQSIQALNQARIGYVAAIIDYNQTQYQLLAALGQPPRSAPQP